MAPDTVNRWLSRFFSHPVQLRWISEQPQRRVNKWPDVPLSFAGGYPLLLLNEVSFHDLQNRCPAGIRAEQFRANIWVAGALPWEEDQWSVIQIGRVTFDVTKPCSRYVFTTINPENGRKHPTGEPMQTLASFLQAADDSHNVDFGLNLLARNTGVIRQGDKVSILQTAPARPYQSKPADHRRETGETPSAAPVTIQYAGQVFHGNQQQVLLEQLEQQGFDINYFFIKKTLS